MIKSMKKRLVVLMMIIILSPLFRVLVFAEDADENQIHVMLENRTYGAVVSADAMYEDVLGVVGNSLPASACVYGNEWAVMTAARAGVLSKEQAEAYYADLEATVRELGSGTLDSVYATTNARVILALSAMGKTPSKVAGYDLLEPLADMNYISGQGANAAMYVLLALDANQYEIPEAPAGAVQTTRDGLIQMILDAELSGGGWAWTGDSAEPDLTANALQALAPYHNDNPLVSEAVRRGLQALSDIQNPDGSFSNWGTANAGSTAQVLTALTSLGIDPVTDSRFIKNGASVIDGLGAFYIAGSGFCYELDATEVDLPFSTVQAAYALVSYQRFTKGQNSLYNMTDAFPDLSERSRKTSAATVAILLGLAAAMAGGIIMLRRHRKQTAS